MLQREVMMNSPGSTTKRCQPNNSRGSFSLKSGAAYSSSEHNMNHHKRNNNQNDDDHSTNTAQYHDDDVDSSRTKYSSKFGRRMKMTSLWEEIKRIIKIAVIQSGMIYSQNNPDRNKRRRIWSVAMMSILSVIVLLSFIVSSASFGNSMYESNNPIHPQTIGCYFDHSSNQVTKVRRLPTHNEDLYPTKRQIEGWTEENQIALDESNGIYKEKDNKRKDKRKGRHKEKKKHRTTPMTQNEVFGIRRGCEAKYQWQVTFNPSCNKIHEQDMNNFHPTTINSAKHGNKSIDQHREQLRLLTHGYFRDLWMTRQFQGQQIALKTLRFEHDFTTRNHERHRRDAVIMDRLSSSSNIIDIYGFCGQSTISTFAKGGTIDELLWPKKGNCTVPMIQRVEIARQVAASLTDLHNVDRDGVATVAHTDITTSQFLWVGDSFKLNDFNRARFMFQKRGKDETCSYRVSSNPGTFRAPEEYAYEEETEKVDIYSMGNIFYALGYLKWPFEELESKLTDEQIQKKIKEGERPDLWNTDDPNVVVLNEAIKMCWVQEPEERAPAKDVLAFLERELRKLSKSENST